FYVWHRGFVGFFEETVRHYSGNPDFAFPYWDWTNLPRIPDGMFDGPLTPRADDYKPYTKDYETFAAFIKAPLESYFNGLNADQRQQQVLRGFQTFDDLWQNMLSCTALSDRSYAETVRARYLTRENPNLDAKTADEASPEMIAIGLLPTRF